MRNAAIRPPASAAPWPMWQVERLSAGLERCARSERVEGLSPGELLRSALAGMRDVRGESVLAEQDTHSNGPQLRDAAFERGMRGLTHVEVRHRDDGPEREVSSGVVDAAASGFGDQAKCQVVLVPVGPLSGRVQRHRRDQERVSVGQDVGGAGLLVCRAHRVTGEFGQVVVEQRSRSRGKDKTRVIAPILRVGDGAADVANRRCCAPDQVENGLEVRARFCPVIGVRHHAETVSSFDVNAASAEFQLIRPRSWESRARVGSLRGSRPHGQESDAGAALRSPGVTYQPTNLCDCRSGAPVSDRCPNTARSMPWTRACSWPEMECAGSRAFTTESLHIARSGNRWRGASR